MKLVNKLLNKFQKKHIVFLTIVPLLIITASIKVECPICQGNGYVNSTPSMENVEVIESESIEKYVTRDACGMFILYQYDIELSIVNKGVEAAEGWLKLTLEYVRNNRIVDTKYLPINIPGETLLNVTYTVWFGSSIGIDSPGQAEVTVDVVVGDVPDIVCNGTGKVSLNMVFFVRVLKDSLVDIARYEQVYKPPLETDWEIYADYFDVMDK